VEERFVERARPRWQALEAALQRGDRTGEDWSRLAELYRDVCADLARSETMALGPDVRAYLHGLAGRGHHALYGSRALRGLRPVETVFRDFPRALRANAGLLLLATALFYGTGAVGFSLGHSQSEFAATLLGDAGVAEVEAMYREAPTLRTGTDDAGMAGFYVYNNVGIALRAFATGALLGLPTLYIVIHNGLVLGTVAGHLTRVGHGANLLSFVAAHAPWELTGIVVAATGGLRLALALVYTGGRTRRDSLRAAGPELGALVAGMVALLLVAALIEGFVSASPLPVALRLGLGVAGTLLVGAWLLFGGRR
jgi:uncharacterized membrane protein SpoIIM required for sporulation